MKKQIPTLFLLLISFLGHSQINSNDQVVYLDSLKRIGTIENYKYLRIVKEYKLDKKLYDVAIYYKSGKLNMRGSTTDKDNLKLEGSCVYFFENGNRKKIANYIKNKPFGKEFEWYENGDVKLESEVIQDYKDNTEITRIIQYWDENKTQKVIDGEGEYTEKETDKKTFSKGRIKNYLKEGTWIGNSSKYKISFVETYNKGKLISGVSTDSLKFQRNYNQILINATPKKGIVFFLKYFGSQIKIPAQKNTILKGTIYLSFTIDKNGKLLNVKTLNKDNYGISDNALKLVSKFDEWLPGYYRGVPIQITNTFPITLK
ncbi:MULTISPECIES: energy transducer TonB [Flavobacterium]|uniref:Energy transducer TonB n=1 Tax=Flavobacterium keumense TaxID=1306518 RepID=A0ABY8N5K0_9FLAO|nr:MULTISPECIES: energy transducer TonB [Flavobacterium]WGK94792.1 energy transducer TonB [Flavobacterium keumense]